MKRMLIALTGCLLAACSLLPMPAEPSSSAAYTQVVADLGQGIELEFVGEDSRVQQADVGDCAEGVHRLTTPSGEYEVMLLGPECTNEFRALNGEHGYFVTPPPATEVAKATTPLGPARLFSHPYEECTNGCRSGTDEVALVRVGSRTLQVIAVAQLGGSAHERDRAQLVSLLQGLRKS
ncbi:MAG: hypothetical protein ACOH1Y_17585 [Propionicimonas sp.]